MEPSFEEVRRAAERVRPHVHRTPVLTSASLDAMTGGRLYFKCENLQRGGAFKIRGATNAVLSLPEEQAGRGVVTHSSGNHGQAVALAAAARGIPAWVVVPDNAPRVKREAVAGYGGQVTLCAPTAQAREAAAVQICDETGATLLHSYENPWVIAGQGTAALELLEELPDLDLLLMPVGGGGLAAGSALAASGAAPGCRVIACEPAGADDTYRSFRAGERLPGGHPQTIADGLRMPVGELAFPILQRILADVVRVSEEAIVGAMRRIFERMKLVVEPSAAVPLAAILQGEIDPEGRRVGIILSGGNVDLDRLPWTVMAG